MSFLMPQQALSMALEYIINQALAMNKASNTALLSLEQQTLVLHLAELNFPLCFTCHQEQILVTGNTESANCTITTSIGALKAIKKDNALTQAIKDDLLVIDGDLKIAQQFMSIAESFDIDWQSELAQHIGDIPTYKLEQSVRTASDKVNFATKQIESDASEWLVHEKKLLVTTNECQHFIQQVGNITQQTNNMIQRLQALEATLTPSQENT